MSWWYILTPFAHFILSLSSFLTLSFNWIEQHRMLTNLMLLDECVTTYSMQFGKYENSLCTKSTNQHARTARTHVCRHQFIYTRVKWESKCKCANQRRCLICYLYVVSYEIIWNKVTQLLKTHHTDELHWHCWQANEATTSIDVTQITSCTQVSKYNYWELAHTHGASHTIGVNRTIFSTAIMKRNRHGPQLTTKSWLCREWLKLSIICTHAVTSIVFCNIALKFLLATVRLWKSLL